MKHIIILKGKPNSGKTTILKVHLPTLLDMPVGKRVITYKGIPILLIRCSIHETYRWEDVMRKIVTHRCPIIIVPAWDDESLSKSRKVKITMEQIMTSHSTRAMNIHIFHTTPVQGKENQLANQLTCAEKIRDYLDSIIPQIVKKSLHDAVHPSQGEIG